MRKHTRPIAVRGSLGRFALTAAMLVVVLTMTLPAGAGAAQSAPACATPGAASPAASPAENVSQAIAGLSSLKGTPAAATTPCPSPAPASSPTPVPTPIHAAQPTPTPVSAQAKGELAATLPPPDLPGANEQGYTFNLNAKLTVGFDKVPGEAPIYNLGRIAYSAQDVQGIADRLQIGGKVQDRGNGTFVVAGNGQLFVSPDVVQFISAAKVAGGTLPADDDAIGRAREWLRQVGLTPPDIGDGKVISRSDDTNRLIVSFGPVEPDNVLSAYPSVTVTLDAKGQVLEADSRWDIITRGDVYKLRAAKEVWQLVQSGQAYIEVDLPSADYAAGSQINGTAEYSDVSLGYTTAGPPGGNQYLEPVFVFSGRVTPNKSKLSFPIRAYVPALALSNQPVG